uniref:VASt domain-containing protein n=1 Tax=Alexandrium catenella TaxID=2925 RepID=A0A7S1LGN9_ALECA|mmetsp:Transcript_113307/g.301072  ORF Transcript_113307/g.301072 Transcript_113307/m.301072 type:complete len:488 (+) Transcript_113307:66-1529(+)|eukprot:CAMPEP_0171190358 /NCGR_PEP_ID=MMETSP0790-20130122/18816_1 /TAXON_ID=2925 /ORGANISM="Alexandrium catenella, Strain OF101" /LENGTH=487 /DNA_ID=CAMNT_0011655489 /DNA_START=58 /DNA_END=1521 /DNA_ORIENTATION=-
MGCFSWIPCIGGQAAKDARAQKQARAGLQDIVKGYRQIAKLDLPAGAASVLADVRRNIIGLEKILRDAKMPKPRQWLLPLPQEQTDWEAVFPKGGFLLRRQMCMASFGDEDWAVGCLFISDFGIAFDSGPIVGQSAAATFETGFLPWQDLPSLSKSQAGKAKAVVTATVAGGRKFSKLCLQLSIQGDEEWLLEFWKLRMASGKAHVDEGGDESWSVPDMDEGVRVPPPSMKIRLMSPSANRDKVEPEAPPTNFTTQLEDDNRGERLHRTGSILVARRKTVQQKVDRRWTENLSSGFAGTPTAETPSNAPTSCQKLEDMSQEMVGKALEDDECLVRFITETLKSSEISPMPWAKSRMVDSTLVRKITFMMKLPDDVPRVVKRLISLPESSSVTMLYRLRNDSNGVVLTYQTCTHDVTFGENFRVQETLVFAPLGNGGTELKRFAEVVWVAPLPWTMGSIRTYIEDKAKSDGAKSVCKLVDIIKEIGGK